MIILTDKDTGVRRVSEIPAQLSEFDHLVRLKAHAPFEVLFSGVEPKFQHYILSRASESDGEVYITFEVGRNVPWWVRFYATKIDLSKQLVLERINKLKTLMEGTLNYFDLVDYTLNAPVEELIFNCAELGYKVRSSVMGMSDLMCRRYILCELLGKYLLQRNELSQ